MQSDNGCVTMKVIDALQSLKNVDLVRFHTEAQESVCRAHEF